MREVNIRISQPEDAEQNSPIENVGNSGQNSPNIGDVSPSSLYAPEKSENASLDEYASRADKRNGSHFVGSQWDQFKREMAGGRADKPLPERPVDKPLLLDPAQQVIAKMIEQSRTQYHQMRVNDALSGRGDERRPSVQALRAFGEEVNNEFQNKRMAELSKLDWNKEAMEPEIPGLSQDARKK